MPENKVSISDQIKTQLYDGYGVCGGLANTLTNSQSGARRLREIVERNAKNYSCVYLESENGGTYKVIFHAIRCRVKIKPLLGKYIVMVATSRHTALKTKLFDTRKEAKDQIKSCVRGIQ